MIHCNTAIKACCSGAWLQALNFLEQMLQMRLWGSKIRYGGVGEVKPTMTFSFSEIVGECLISPYGGLLKPFERCSLRINSEVPT